MNSHYISNNSPPHSQLYHLDRPEPRHCLHPGYILENSQNSDVRALLDMRTLIRVWLDIPGPVGLIGLR
jgi:hypothetical protein